MVCTLPFITLATAGSESYDYAHRSLFLSFDDRQRNQSGHFFGNA